MFDESSMHPAHLRIETVVESLFMRPKRLACLDACLQHPVWVFETRNAKQSDDYNSESPKRLAVSILLADLADLWGPINLKYSETETANVAEIAIRGGTIRRSEPSVPSSCLPNETECHWYSWLGKSPRLEDQGSLSTTGRLLIGALGNACQLPEEFLQDSSTCNSRAYAHMFPEYELGTKPPSWNIDSKSGQVSGGKYINITYGQTWKFDAGWTLKQIIIEDWLEDVSKSEMHRPNPCYLDYMVVIETSPCSGHSRRLSLWQLIASNAVDRYVSGILELESREDFQTLKAYGLCSIFADIWREKLSETHRRLVMKIIYGLLRILRHTGVAEDGSLRTWDITSQNRIDGRRINPKWTSMVKDDTISASFAVMTDRCFKFNNVPCADPSYQQDSVLLTKICITMDRPAKREPWTPKDINQWRVMQSQELSAVDDPRIIAIEEARLKSRPDFSSLEMRQSSRGAEIGFSDFKFANIQEQRKLRVSTRSALGIAIYDTVRQMKETRLKQDGPRNMLCNRCVDFRNGKGNRIGTLTLQFHEHILRINLSGLSENHPLPVGWDAYRDSRIAKLWKKAKGKARKLDAAAIDGVKIRFTNPLPWLVEPDTEEEAFREYAVEHIRGGDAADGQKILTVHVH